jgi:hypothetical protein
MVEKYRGTPNPELHKAMQELRRSSAAQPHQDRRTKRARSRADKLRKAIEDQK